MPIKESAKKALRKSLKGKERNLAYKEKIKRLLKKAKILISGKKTEEVKKILPEIYKILDKAAKKNIIKKGKANRIKSKISKLVFRSQKPKDREQVQG
jgi:ribosomal protein S20